MDRVTHKAQILEERFAVSVLLTLLEQGKPVIKGVLTSLLSTGSRAVADRVKDLQNEGLISETVEEKKPFRHFVELTPLGKDVALRLKEIESLLGGVQ